MGAVRANARHVCMPEKISGTQSASPEAHGAKTVFQEAWPGMLKSMCVQAGWRQRRRDARRARAALKQSGQQPDLKSECTGAQSMSTSRPQASGKAQQNGSLQRLEQEAQSARVSPHCPLCICSIGEALQKDSGLPTPVG